MRGRQFCRSGPKEIRTPPNRYMVLKVKRAHPELRLFVRLVAPEWRALRAHRRQLALTNPA